MLFYPQNESIFSMVQNVHFGINSLGATDDWYARNGNLPASPADITPGTPDRIKNPSTKLLLGESKMAAQPKSPYCLIDSMNGHTISRHNGSGNILWADGHAAPVRYLESFTTDTTQRRDHLKRGNPLD